MASPFENGGAGSIVAQFSLDIPNGTDTRLTGTQVAHTESRLIESVYEPCVYEHQFTMRGLDFMNRILRLALASATPTLWFRFGYGTGDLWLPWQKHVIISHAILPEGREPGGGVLRLVTADQLYVMDRASKVITRSGKISDIVAAIAEENGLEAVVEPTATAGVYIQSFQTDAEFIRKRLKPRATSEKGVSNYLLFVKDNVLHFHTPTYHADLRRADYFNSTAYRLLVSDHTQKLFDRGIAGVRMIAYDPYTGEGREVDSDASRSIRYADTLYPAAAVEGAQLNLVYHLSQNTPDEVEAIAQNAFDETRASSQQVEISFSHYVEARPGDLFHLTFNQAQGQPSPQSGLYHVLTASHAIKENAINSVYTLQRGESTRISSDTLTQGPDQQVVTALTAPGQPVNIGELTASTLTKGGGNATSATLLRSVADATRLPT